jgi:hypothetical protein
MDVKVCIKCGKELSLDNFNKASGNKDGLNNQCKQCKAEYKKQWYQENKKEIQEQRKQYSDAHKKDKAEYDAKYRADNKERIAKYMKQYYENNRDILLEQNRRYWVRYYKKNRVMVLAKSKKWREENRERMSFLIKTWAQNNKDRVNIKTNRRRAKARSLPYSLTHEQWEQIKKYFKNRCCYCGRELPLEQDHFVPVNKGGGYACDNIVPACRNCNATKNDKIFSEWYPQQEFYSPWREYTIIACLELNK